MSKRTSSTPRIPDAAVRVQAFAQEQPLKYALLTGLGCGIVYLVLVEAFLTIPMFNGLTQVRPASGLSPMLGLFFGWPGILGCSLANLVSDLFHEGLTPWLLLYLAYQLVYNALPYLIWHAAFRKSDFPYPRLDSTLKVFAYLSLMFLASALIALMNMPFNIDSDMMFETTLVQFLNNAIFLVYLGMPLLILLERSPLVPNAPRRQKERAPYAHRPSMVLTQRLLIAAIAFFTVIMALFIAMGYSSYFIEGQVRTAQDLANVINGIYSIAIILTLIGMVPLLAIIRQLEIRFTRPIEALTAANEAFVKQMSQPQETGSALEAAPISREGMRVTGIVENLFETTEAMQEDIVNYVERLETVTAEREHQAAELEIATQIQMGAVPKDFSLLTERYHLDIAAALRPAREVGGDFYDVVDLGEGKIAFLIADVSGKGVPAALFMMRALTELRERLLDRKDPGEALTLANQMLCEGNDATLFVTCFVCVLDTGTGHLAYANAGHNPPWIRQNGHQGWLKGRHGLVLGAMEDMIWRTTEIDLAPGDGMLLYTDGVTEAQNGAEELFGEARFEEAFTHDVQGESAQETVDMMLACIDEFAHDAPQQADDITMLAFAWNLPVHAISLPPEDAALDDLFNFVKGVSDSAGCTKRMVFDLMLVLEELFVNIAHYGFPEGVPVQPVSVRIAVDQHARRMHLALSDAGIPFNPLEHQPEKPTDAATAKIGGLGILLAREKTERMTYEREGGYNVVRLVKEFV